MTDLEAEFLFYWKLFAPDAPEPEHDKRFHPVRRWRADFIWRDQMVIVEMMGGVWMKTRTGRSGGHAFPAKLEKDYEKMNAAISLGWRVYQFTAKMLNDDPHKCISLVLSSFTEK